MCISHHAGGVGLLMRSLPHAQLVVHPRGARHLIDPTQLLAFEPRQMFLTHFGPVGDVQALGQQFLDSWTPWSSWA